MSNDSPDNDTPVQFIALREQFELERLVEHYGGWYYRPRLRAGEVRIGYVCVQSDSPPTKDDLKGLSAAPMVVRADTDLVKEELLLAKPERWERLFPKGKPGNGDLCVYRPIPGNAHVALSDCAFRYGPGFSEKDPDPDFRCVHKALVGNSEFMSNAIWKDRQSAWNIQGGAFFAWQEDERYPSDMKPFVLSDGTLFGNVQPESFQSKPSGSVAWQPIQFYQSNYNNSTSDQEAHFTFEATLASETSVTGMWQRADQTEIESTFTAAVEYVTEVSLGTLAKVTQSNSVSWAQALKKTVLTSIGGGTTKVSAAHHRQSCTVIIPPKKDLTVTATFFRGEYDLSFTGMLRYASAVRGTPPLEIPLTGQFAVKVDTLTTWWEVGDGTFVSKTLPTPL